MNKSRFFIPLISLFAAVTTLFMGVGALAYSGTYSGVRSSVHSKHDSNAHSSGANSVRSSSTDASDVLPSPTSTPIYRYITHIRIPSADASGHHSAVIAANLFLPNSAYRQSQLCEGTRCGTCRELHRHPIKTRFPVVIFANSWGSDQYEYQHIARELASQGYIVLSYSARGWGESTGKINVGGPLDMMDVHHVIDWVLAHTPADPNRIAMAGISYGAGMSLLAAEHDPRIHVVIAMSGWANLYTALIFNHTPSALWLKILLLAAHMKHAQLSDHSAVMLQTLAHYKFSPALKQFAAVRSPITDIQALEKRHVAVFLSNNLEDQLFPVNNMLAFYVRLKTPHKIFFISPGAHAAAEWSGLQGKPSVLWPQAIGWLNHYLKGWDHTHITTHFLATPTYTWLMVKPDNQPNYHRISLNTLMHQPQIYYLQAYRQGLTFGALRSDPPPSQQSWVANTITQGASCATQGDYHSPLFELIAYHEGLSGSNVYDPVTMTLPDLKSTHALAYVTPALVRPMTVIGIPKVHVWIRLNHVAHTRYRETHSVVAAQLIAYLYDVAPTGKATLMSAAPITLYQPQYHRDLHQNQDVETLNVPLKFTAYHVLAHHHLALVLGTEDPAYCADTNEWSNTAVTVLAAYHGAYSHITIPTPLPGVF